MRVTVQPRLLVLHPNHFAFNTFYPVARFPRNLTRAPRLQAASLDQLHPKAACWLKQAGDRILLLPGTAAHSSALLSTELCREVFCSPQPPASRTELRAAPHIPYSRYSPWKHSHENEPLLTRAQRARRSSAAREGKEKQTPGAGGSPAGLSPCRLPITVICTSP